MTMRDDVIARARKLTDGATSYEIEEDPDDKYGERAGKFAAGPGGWRGMLGEPEDCTYYRDGNRDLVRLNELDRVVRDLLTLLTQETAP